MCTPLVENQQIFATICGNRVAEIKRASDITFRYIPSDQNPQHGAYPQMNFQIPPYGGMGLCGLRNLKYFGLSVEITPEVLKETQTDAPTVFYEVAALAGQTCNDQDKRSSRYLRLRKLLRVTVYCLKFIKQLIWRKLLNEFKRTIRENKDWCLIH